MGQPADLSMAGPCFYTGSGKAITRSIVGEIVSKTDNGKISREGFNLQSLNPNSIVKWNVVVPGGEKEISYTYKIYVRK